MIDWVLFSLCYNALSPLRYLLRFFPTTTQHPSISRWSVPIHCCRLLESSWFFWKVSWNGPFMCILMGPPPVLIHFHVIFHETIQPQRGTPWLTANLQQEKLQRSTLWAEEAGPWTILDPPFGPPEKLCLAPKFQYLLLYILLLVTICFGRHFWGIYRYNEISRGIQFSYQVLFSVWLNMQIRLLSLLDSQFWPPTRQLSSTALLRCTCTSALRLADNILICIYRFELEIIYEWKNEVSRIWGYEVLWLSKEPWFWGGLIFTSTLALHGESHDFKRVTSDLMPSQWRHRKCARK